MLTLSGRETEKEYLASVELQPNSTNEYYSTYKYSNFLFAEGHDSHILNENLLTDRHTIVWMTLILC